MPIWFVYRSPYDGPMNKHVRRFDNADTLLDWFRAIWQPVEMDSAYDHARQLLGTDAYSFGGLFAQIHEGQLPPPTTMTDLHQLLESALYSGDYFGGDDTIQHATEDDDWAMGLYWFTDDFAQRHPARVAYLLREDWRLPDTHGPGGFRSASDVHDIQPPVAGEKAIYLLAHDLSGCGDPEDLRAPDRLPGLRLPDLVPWLLTKTDDELDEISGHQLALTRQMLGRVLESGNGLEGSFRRSLIEDPSDEATWAAYSDWLIEHDQLPASLYLLDLALKRMSVEPNERCPGPHPERALANRHSASAILPAEHCDMYDQWYFFDDLWASANADLANALIDYTGRWNVLDDYSR